MSLRSPVTLVKDSVRFYKTHFSMLMTLALVPALLFAIGNYIMDSHTDAEGTILAASFSSAEIGIFVLVMIGAVVLQFIAYIALALFIAHPTRYASWTEVYAEAKKYFFPYLWMTILIMLAIFGGFILLVIPGIIFSVWFGFSGFTLLLEGKRGAEALKASKRLVTRKWFAVFGRQLLVGLLYGIATIVLYFILALLIPQDDIASAMHTVGSYLMAPIMMIASYFMYTDLKAVPVPPSDRVPEPPKPSAS